MLGSFWRTPWVHRYYIADTAVYTPRSSFNTCGPSLRFFTNPVEFSLMIATHCSRLACTRDVVGYARYSACDRGIPNGLEGCTAQTNRAYPIAGQHRVCNLELHVNQTVCNLEFTYNSAAEYRICGGEQEPAAAPRIRHVRRDYIHCSIHSRDVRGKHGMRTASCLRQRARNLMPPPPQETFERFFSSESGCMHDTLHRRFQNY